MLRTNPIAFKDVRNFSQNRVTAQQTTTESFSQMNHVYSPDEFTLPMPVPAKRRRSGMRRKLSGSTSHENDPTKKT